MPTDHSGESAAREAAGMLVGAANGARWVRREGQVSLLIPLGTINEVLALLGSQAQIGGPPEEDAA